uniref:ATPase family AAA domain containing 5 n=1 Tax=Leptobrachium leishanense TaxID=445787 RepID=A0A8C5QRY6_9ANUR
MLCFGVIVLSQIIQMFQGPRGPPQPCKKLRKDEDHPIKTITNYFSPVSKVPDKVLSSPRSSNIADYFKKCSPAAEKEKTPNAKRSSPNRDGSRGKSSLNQTPTTSKETGKLKRRGKRTSLTKRLYDVPTAVESEVVDADEVENVCGGTGFMGSDTAALLAEICGKDDELDIQSKRDQPSTAKTLSPSRTKLSSKSRKRKPDKDVKSAHLQTIRPQEVQPNVSGVPDGNSLQSDNNVKDESHEVDAGDASGDVRSTVTVSFEDFVKSQQKGEATNVPSDSKIEALDSCPPAEIDGEANATAPPNAEPSLNKVTVQAQIHLTPPLQSSSTRNKRAKRIPSIFRKKGEAEMDVPTSGRRSSEIEQAEQVFQKRKSNVVILEEDFELAVLEVENLHPSKPKSTPAERQQFLKAFKQPREIQKNGVKKSLGKKRDSEEGLAAANSPMVHNSESDAVTPSAAQDGDGGKKKKSATRASKLKKKTSRVKQNADGNTESKAEIDDEKKVKASSAPVAEQSESPAASGGPRRSSRQRKSTSPFKSPVQVSSHTDTPSCTSTPKVSTPCRKDDFYKAEVITIPSDTESPIRMRFTRVRARWSHNRSLAEDEAFTQRSRKVTGTSKTQNKAKELLEKAKAMQKNMASGETPRRRSGRHKPDKNLDSEDPAAVVEIACKSPPKPTKKNNLRSLNDVLGKKAKIKKKRNVPSGKKKSIGKPPATIVLDDSSEVSESSQDNEQFKAKREFLRSGLPESLKRHISKTAAFMEAYSLSSSSFQAAVHVQQKDGYRMWNLNMPNCPRLTGIQNANLDVPDVATLTLAIGDFTFANAKPSVHLPLRLAPSHPVFSDVIRDCLLEEIHATNPLFPGKRFLQQFLKKQSDQFVLSETKPGGPVQEVNSVDDVILIEGSEASETNTRTKRKRKDSPASKLKRLKSAENPKADTKPLDALEITVQGATRGSLSRAARKQKRGGGIPPSIEAMPAAGAADRIIEDLLWTEKYQPLNSSELVGNSVAVKRLHGWLKEWKIRAEKEENRSQISKVEKDKNDTWDHGDFKGGSDSEDDFSLCNTILISGPAGVGKTAAVYACAQELGFKVFEVNASGQRSGRQILTQLKEATQSHQVDQQGVNAQKPCFFNSHCTTKSPRKINSPKRVIASPRKVPLSPRGSCSRRGLAPKSLSNFFKVPVKQKADNTPASQEVKSKPAPIIVEDNEVKATKTQVPNTERGHGAEESHKKTATSLILFEEVDVIFDDDLGFLSAVKTFMATTKRPVILTTSDPMFSLMFDGVFEEILFHTPSIVNITSYLQVLCLAENLRTDSKDFAALLAANKCDIRQSVLNLQFWARSGGGVLRAKPLTLSGGNPSGGSRSRDDLPKCHFGCAENAIGLNNIVSPEEDLLCFVKDRICATEERSRIVQLLAEFQTTKIHFTTSNLAFLLPLPLHIVEPTKPPASTGPGAVMSNEAVESPVKMSARMRRKRQLVLLNDSDLFESDSNSSDLLNLPSSTLPPKEIDAPSHSVTPVTFERRKLTDTEKRQSSLVHQCLGSVAEFVDNMSYLDCFTHDAAERAEFRHAHWTESRIKNGLCDTLRIENNRDWWCSHSSSELKANLEALSYHKCSSDISRFLELYKTSGEELSPDLSLHVPKHDEVYFSRTTGQSEVAAKRLDVVRSVLSSKSFITLGNRQANITDYLPALRNMCRFQRLKEEEKSKRRFLHYFEGIHLELPKKTTSSLAADFP